MLVFIKVELSKRWCTSHGCVDMLISPINITHGQSDNSHLLVSVEVVLIR